MLLFGYVAEINQYSKKWLSLIHIGEPIVQNDELLTSIQDRSDTTKYIAMLHFS